MSDQQLSVYVPANKAKANLVERAEAVAKADDRSLNYIIVKAIETFVEQAEGEEL